MRTAVIIGGGLGGLFTGAILSKEGFKVTVLEKNTTVELQAFWLEIRYRDACYWRNASWRQHLSYLSVFRYSRQGVIDERR